jgi:hypothetical protein
VCVAVTTGCYQLGRETRVGLVFTVQSDHGARNEVGRAIGTVGPGVKGTPISISMMGSDGSSFIAIAWAANMESANSAVSPTTYHSSI